MEEKTYDKPRVIVDSVEALDTLLDEGYTLPPITAHTNLFSRKFADASPIHVRLRQLKYLYGAHPATEEQFLANKRRMLSSAAGGDPLVHLRGYAKALNDINYTHRHVFGGGRVKRFLDLGCSPGGFSDWLLQYNPGAVGLGITLPDEDASWEIVVEGTRLMEPRYTLRFADIISLVHSCVSKGEDPTIRLEDDSSPSPDPFDLVICGAFPTMGRISWKDRTRLSLGQCLIMLRNLAPGGNALIVMNTKTFRWTVELLGILRQCFQEVAPAKGKKLHLQRSSCYVVCTGFHGPSAQVDQFAESLRRVLVELGKMPEPKAGSESDEGEDESEPDEMTAEDKLKAAERFHLLPLSYDALFEAEHKFTLQIFEPMWEIQTESIYWAFVKILRQEQQRRQLDSPVAPRAYGTPPGNMKIDPSLRSPTDDHGGSSSSVVAFATGAPLTPSSPSSPTNKWRIPARRLSSSGGNGEGWRARGEERVGPYSAPFFQRPVGPTVADASSSWRAKRN